MLTRNGVISGSLVTQLRGASLVPAVAQRNDPIECRGRDSFGSERSWVAIACGGIKLGPAGMNGDYLHQSAVLRMLFDCSPFFGR